MFRNYFLLEVIMPNLDKETLNNIFYFHNDKEKELIHWALSVLDDKDSEQIFLKIVSEYSKRKLSKGSEESSQLIAMLQGTGSCEVKWNAVNDYGKNPDNLGKTLKFIIEKVIPPMLPQMVFDKGITIENTDLAQAHTYYKQAGALAAKFNKDIVDESYKHEHATALKLINGGQYNSACASSLNNGGVHKHNAVLLGNSLSRTFAPFNDPDVGVALEVMLWIPPLLAMGVAAGVVTTVCSGLHGFFTMATRKPLNAAELNIMFNNLSKMSVTTDTEKLTVIKKVVEDYRQSQSGASSDSSGALFLILQNKDKPVSEKWDALVSYMTERFENKNLLKSNGKKLFRIIDSAMAQHLETQPQLEQAAAALLQLRNLS